MIPQITPYALLASPLKVSSTLPKNTPVFTNQSNPFITAKYSLEPKKIEPACLSSVEAYLGAMH